MMVVWVGDEMAAVCREDGEDEEDGEDGAARGRVGEAGSEVSWTLRGAPLGKFVRAGHSCLARPALLQSGQGAAAGRGQAPGAAPWDSRHRRQGEEGGGGERRAGTGRANLAGQLERGGIAARADARRPQH